MNNDFWTFAVGFARPFVKGEGIFFRVPTGTAELLHPRSFRRPPGQAGDPDITMMNLRFVGWNFEVHKVAFKAARFPGAERYAGGHPNRAEDSCLLAQVPPKNEADQKSEDRR
jgi:hypothetical protein